MITIQEALKQLYYSLGGNADNVRDTDDVNEILLKISKLGIGESTPSFTVGKEGTKIVDETTVSFSSDASTGLYKSGNDPISGMTFNTVADGKIYKVVWDGDEYWCFGSDMAQLSSTQTGNYRTNVVGDIGIFGYDDPFDVDCPFCITKKYKQTDTNVVVIFTTSDAASHTVEVWEYAYTATMPAERVLFPYNSYNGAPIIFLGADGKAVNLGGSAKSANGEGSVAEGIGTVVRSNGAHAEGIMTQATETGAHAEGINNTASKSGAHAEGNQTQATNSYTHAEGVMTTASGSYAHAEGYKSVASGNVSHAEGQQTTASGNMSSALGSCTIAKHKCQHVFGLYNAPDESTAGTGALGNYIEIVGNGTAEDARSNARTLDWSGNEALAGSITLGKGTEDEVTMTAAQLKALLATL